MSTLLNRPGRVKAPRPKPVRTVRLVEPPLAWLNEGEGELVITDGPTATTYFFREYVSQMPGRAFHVRKATSHAPKRGIVEHVEEYDCRVHTTADSNCCCLGFEHYGHCRHVESLGELIRLNKLPVYLSAGDQARNDPEAFARHQASTAAAFTPRGKDAYVLEQLDGDDDLPPAA